MYDSFAQDIKIKKLIINRAERSGTVYQPAVSHA